MPTEKSFTNISSCQDIVQCAFNLNPFEVEIYKAVARSGPIRADDLAEKVGKDRSTVYRALQKLMSCGMCFRETKNLEKGGYFHVYGAIPCDILKKRLEQCVQDWHSKMLKVLDEFEHQFGNDFSAKKGTKENTL